MSEALAHNSEIQKGSLLGGKYRLEREIGRGAMGTVWSAIHESLRQRVAVKVISPEHANSEELRKRFDTEARAAAKLRSRFVVAVSDNGLTKTGVPYIVMEYLDGECLEDRIVHAGHLSLAETSRVARHVARALTRAHSRGIVHRDLKPANIFLTRSEDDDDHRDWTAKVLDFGIAKMDDHSDRSTTKTGAVLGTPLFMSPEQVRGASSVDHRADLYSFGMVIYNMLTGTFAFEGQSFGDLLVSICTDPLPELSRTAPHLPAELDAWFRKACAREPDDRFQSAGELVTAFLEAVGEAPSTSLLSMSDITTTSDSRVAISTAAQTLAANSGSQAGISQVDTGASAHTVHEIPKKSRLPALLAVTFVLLGVVVTFQLLGAKKGAPQLEDTVTSTQTISDGVAPAVPAETSLDPEAKTLQYPTHELSAASNTDTLSEKIDEDRQEPSSTVSPPRSQVRPRPPSSTSHAEESKPPPSRAESPSPSVPDLGF